MADLHPAAGHVLPPFITAPGSSDWLLMSTGVFLLLAIVAVGVFFLWLHSLPERMVHNKWQYDLVAVLCLIALFTHIHAFWIAALILALIRIPDVAVPDYHTPLRNIARSLDKIANEEPAAAGSPTAAKQAAARESIAGLASDGATGDEGKDAARDA